MFTLWDQSLTHALNVVRFTLILAHDSEGVESSSHLHFCISAGMVYEQVCIVEIVD